MENRETSSDEIDLQELLLKFILIIKENLLLIVLFFIIGLLLGFTYGMLGTKVYESKMLVTSNLLTESYAEEMGDNFNKILRDQNTNLIAEKLGLTTAEASMVASIRIKGVLEEEPIETLNTPTASEDIVRKRIYFLAITANVLDPSVLPNLQKGIVNYFENNEFVKVRVDQKRKHYTQIIKKLDEEILSLDELEKKIYEGNFLQSSGAGQFDLSEISKKIIDLTDKKLQYESELATVNSIEAVEGFTKFNLPAKPNKAVSIAAGASLGLFFVGLLIAFKSVRSLVRLAEKK